jgi:polyferredoxin
LKVSKSSESPIAETETAPRDSGEIDVLRWPVVGAFLKWKHSRTLLQIPLLVVSVVMILHGFFGPQIDPKNFATVLTWVYFRGALVLVLLAAGNFFCLACPFMLVRNAARKLFTPRWNWPQALRNKWISVALLVTILFVYELFDLWSLPYWTAALAAGYFAAALAVDALFKHAAFCKYVCPIGQFNFIASTLSPLEVKVRSHAICDRCATKDCIRGRRADATVTVRSIDAHVNATSVRATTAAAATFTPSAAATRSLHAAQDFVILQRGCELALFQPRKVGNMDCTFCLDCVHACPHDNIGVSSRLPGTELVSHSIRSGIGYFSKRTDIAALVVVFCFGALVNAFGMVSPIYAVEEWLEKFLHVKHEAPVLGMIFVAILVIAPALLLSIAAWFTRALKGSTLAMTPLAVRYSYALAPLGFGMWLAHYGFHFFTGLLTIVPVTQSAAASIGISWLGVPRWTWTGLATRYVQPIELGFLFLGFAGSLVIAHQLAEEDSAEHPMRAFLPWAAVAAIVCAASVWLMFQPMEMRATLMGG